MYYGLLCYAMLMHAQANEKIHNCILSTIYYLLAEVLSTCMDGGNRKDQLTDIYGAVPLFHVCLFVCCITFTDRITEAGGSVVSFANATALSG